MQKSGRSSAGAYTVGITALFLAGFLLLMIFGARSYRRTVEAQDRNMYLRALHAYLSTTLKGYDSRDTLSIREDPNAGMVLIIAEGDTGYALRIYQKDGYLLEDYAASDTKLRPDHAQVIAETTIFEPIWDGKVLIVNTDAGRVLFSLRSGETT